MLLINYDNFLFFVLMGKKVVVLLPQFVDLLVQKILPKCFSTMFLSRDRIHYETERKPAIEVNGKMYTHISSYRLLQYP